ncbi:MAG: hypothetical protein H0U76_03530, partial [Ktedonobacteraceae bacterium]|nr:hypothetical protein [Ktedonobacteraceae bacterium]
MSEVTSFIAALGLSEGIRAWDTRREKKNFEREEVFVPFKLPPLRQEQEIGQPMMEDESSVAI